MLNKKIKIKKQIQSTGKEIQYEAKLEGGQKVIAREGNLESTDERERAQLETNIKSWQMLEKNRIPVLPCLGYLQTSPSTTLVLHQWHSVLCPPLLSVASSSSSSSSS